MGERNHSRSSGHDLANTRSAGGDGPTPTQAATLQPYWSFSSTQGDFTGTPVVSGSTVVVGSNEGVVDALDATTGKLLWSRTVGPQVNGSAPIANGVVYVPVNINEGTGAGQPSVAALNLSDGALMWQMTIDNQPGSDVFGSPVVAGGVVYIGVAASYAEDHLPPAHDRGSVVALDALTGAMKWKTYVPRPRRGHYRRRTRPRLEHTSVRVTRPVTTGTSIAIPWRSYGRPTWDRAVTSAGSSVRRRGMAAPCTGPTAWRRKRGP